MIGEEADVKKCLNAIQEKIGSGGDDGSKNSRIFEIFKIFNYYQFQSLVKSMFLQSQPTTKVKCLAMLSLLASTSISSIRSM